MGLQIARPGGSGAQWLPCEWASGRSLLFAQLGWPEQELMHHKGETTSKDAVCWPSRRAVKGGATGKGLGIRHHVF